MPATFSGVAGTVVFGPGAKTSAAVHVSALARTTETAGTLGLDGDWTIDDRWRERDWGEYGVLSGTEQEELFALSSKLRHQSKWYWRPPGGESLATGVRLRFEDIVDTTHRELDGKRVVAVTHGEMMRPHGSSSSDCCPRNGSSRNAATPTRSPIAMSCTTPGATP